MQGFVPMILGCSTNMTLLALLYMATMPLLEKQYAKTGCYYGWLVIILGLIIPLRPQYNNGVFKIDVLQESVPNIEMAAVTPVGAAAYTETATITMWQIITAVWLAGMLLTLAYYLGTHYKFMKLVQRWRERITDTQVISLFHKLQKDLGIFGTIEIYLCPGVNTPMMIGFINPQILLPEIDFSQDELNFIFRHELIHYRRKDLFYKFLVLIATCIHWFNPAVYLMAKIINIECELSCDEEVVKSTDINTRLSYVQTILGMAKNQAKLRTILSTNIYGGKKDMKKRIYCIMDLAKKKAGVSLITCMIFLTMSTGVVFASGTNPRAGTDQFDYEQNLQQVYDEIERNNARQEKEFRESSAEIFLIYEQYGLTYNKETDRLYYNNELVRYFEDNQNTDGTFYGTVFPNTDGNIDIHAVRDSARKLTGLEPYSQDEFDARSLKMQDNGSNATVSGGLVNESPKATN